MLPSTMNSVDLHLVPVSSQVAIKGIFICWIYAIVSLVSNRFSNPREGSSFIRLLRICDNVLLL